MYCGPAVAPACHLADIFGNILARFTKDLKRFLIERQHKVFIKGHCSEHDVQQHVDRGSMQWF
jgi:hypothetical protein